MAVTLVVLVTACAGPSPPAAPTQPTATPAAAPAAAATAAAPPATPTTARPLPTPSPVPTPTPVPTPAPDLVFVPDAGIRIEGGVPTAVLDGGTTYLYFNGNVRLATSTDGLTFGPARNVDPNRERRLAVRMPDGTYRRYVPAGQNCCGLKSYVSKDGMTFTEEPGLRYALHPSDNGTFGVFDTWVDASGGVALLYVGDLKGVNNVRRAYARDGLTFVFEDGNPLGDAQGGGGPRSFVDQRALLLPDGRRRLFVMQAGTIHSFITTDGRTFMREPGPRLRPQDYTERPIRSLHDPSVVRLADGRYRMYVGAFDTSGKEMILSATTR